LLDRLQRITLGADRLQPALNIEKALLPHDSLPPSAHYRVRSASQIRSDLARGIFRGALFFIRLRGPGNSAQRRGWVWRVNAKGPVSDNGAFRTFLHWRGMISDLHRCARTPPCITAKIAR